MNKLDKFLLKELLEMAKQLGIEHKSSIKKDELKKLILEDFSKRDGMDLAWGKLDILNDGYGFLRECSVDKDIYISTSQIKKFKLRSGDIVVGEVKIPVGDERNYAMKKVLLINNGTVEEAEAKQTFEELVPAYPREKFNLEKEDVSFSGRIIDLIAPIGRGQRALIIAPPKAGKTMLLCDLANLIIKNNKDVEVWVLLIDERPEEVTDIRENVIGAEVYASTFDDDPKNHIKVTETIIENAKRKVENGANIVILMDSLTRLARAYNIVMPSSGKILSGGIDPTALYYPKNFFGTARNIRNGGSLTIIATVLVDTGSKMDDIIYEEFKSTGNCDIYLDRSLAELRIFPAIDIQRSGTRKEELLTDKKTLNSIWSIRRHLSELNKAEALIKLKDTLKNTPDNKTLLKQYEKGVKYEK